MAKYLPRFAQKVTLGNVCIRLDTFVEYMPTWAFVSLLVCAFLTLHIAYGYIYLWQDYDLPEVTPLVIMLIFVCINSAYVKCMCISKDQQTRRLKTIITPWLADTHRKQARLPSSYDPKFHQGYSHACTGSWQVPSVFPLHPIDAARMKETEAKMAVEKGLTQVVDKYTESQPSQDNNAPAPVAMQPYPLFMSAVPSTTEVSVLSLSASLSSSVPIHCCTSSLDRMTRM